MVYIVGAGPGDPELITVKGQKCLQQADVVIYAGSLVNPVLLDLCREDAVIYNSASMTLAEVIAVITEAEKAGKMTVRLHTGDPSIYGAIEEQMAELERRGITFTVVPGVSSFLAAAASLRQEYTLPGISQTVILTRQAGRTAVPEREKLRSLAAHRATMCIFLSVTMLDDVAEELTSGGYAPETSVAVVQRASWQNERIVRGTLQDIAAKVREAGIDRTAMIVVGDCLRKSGYEPSRLYAPEFSHGFRQASSEEKR